MNETIVFVDHGRHGMMLLAKMLFGLTLSN